MVPLTLKVMSSVVPVGTQQSPPVVSTPGLLALLIASRSVQNPLPEVGAVSEVLSTVKLGVAVAVGVAVTVGVAVAVAVAVAV